mmetsp:Transcript_91625/g.147919  ORF Transcript_91625/g.147919 Transcript_91625/m.147919 type:complete len:296 (+) Transcript_91625:381-1268(+)
MKRPLPTMDPGWKAVQDAKQKLKGKRLGEEAKRAATDAVVGKKFQETVAASCNTVGAEALAALNSQGYYIKDDFLGQEACEFMRAEAEAFYTAGALKSGKSTRWNTKKEEVETYEKKNVLTMQIQGGSSYAKSPRLVEYVVEITKGVSQAINTASTGPMLLTSHQTNKLAVCLGDGSEYTKHYDNAGGTDRRKLTVLYYMNPNWAVDQGGMFRAFADSDSPECYVDIEPVADRILFFWSDVLVHGVGPSFAESTDQHRYALTVWLVAAEGVEIQKDEAAEVAHFASVAAKGSARD